MAQQKFTPTDEQAAIIDACASGANTKVTALAGTGKTTTLQLAAESMTGKGLYLAFNKSVQREADARFPKHVTARTAHSLAYGPVGRQFRPRMDRQSRISSKALAEAFTVDGFSLGLTEGDLPPSAVAAKAYGTVRRFCYSADTEIGVKHVGWVDGISAKGNREFAAHVLPYSQEMWADLRDPYGRRAYFSHDHYLKIWALTEPQLGYDFIMFDECQDANPILVDLVKRQPGQTIVVGDQNQAIYGWRGAVNALKDWPAKHQLALTESFRFGPEIAAEANKWLSIPELECELRVTGRGPAGYIGDLERPQTILCRTNAGAIREALDALDEPGARVAVVGGGKQIKDMSYAAIDLQRGKRTTHPELAAFGTWSEVQQFVNTEDGAEDLAVFVRLVDEHGPATLIDAVGALVDEVKGKPTVTVSTAHKSKGLEWPTVRIGEDFREPSLDDAGRLKPFDPAEAMLSYVSVTRAKSQLDRSGVAWIDAYLAGKPTPEQTARWLAKKRADGEVKREFDHHMGKVVGEFKNEEREYQQ